MVKVYNNGDEFILENSSFLDLNRYMAVFFYLDAKALKETNKINYAIKVESDNKKLLAIKLEPYNLCLYGDWENLDELINYLNDNNYDLKDILCPIEIGSHLNNYNLADYSQFFEPLILF